MAKIVGNTTATPMVVPDWNQTDEKKADYIKNKPTIVDVNLTNVTSKGLENITSIEFGGEDVVLNQIIKQGQTITDFKAHFSDGTVGTKDDEYVDPSYSIECNEIILDGGNITLTSFDLPYTCDKDITFDWAGFRRVSDSEVVSGSDVVLVVGNTDKIATKKYVLGQIGNVETALDTIIAIQTESVGG